MHLIGVLVLSASTFLVCSGWVQELGGRGLQLGSGVTLRLDPVKAENASLLEKHALRMDYSGMGISIAKTPRQDKLEVGLYYDERGEGRGKQKGQLIIPILAGFKVAALGALMMAAVGGLVLQSLMVAKLSLLVTSLLALYKFFGSRKGKTHASYEQHVQHMSPVVYSYPTMQEYAPTSTGNYVGYANYPPSAHEAAASGAHYAVVEAPDVNATQQLINLNTQAVTLQRRHLSKRKLNAGPYLEIKRYSLK